MESLEKAKLCLRIIRERKAIDPVLIQMGNLTSITDYFLIAGGDSTRQVQAMAQHLRKRMREEGFRPFGVEGEQEGQWTLADYGDVIVHLFYEPTREFYDLEGLWIDAERISADEEAPGKGTSH